MAEKEDAMATPNAAMEIPEDGNTRISIREKLAYSLGDVASNVVWSAAGTYLTFYYTNSVAISAAAAGMIMLVSRIFDGISDIIMGGIIDKTKTRFGKARPWLLWMAGPFALASFLLFSVPRDWSDTGKIIYAFLTYNLMSTVVYTAINLSYGVMNAMMTSNLKDRASLNIYRMVGALLMGIAANLIVIPLVRLFGDGNETNPRGWSLTFLALGILATCLFLLCFFGTKERIYTEVKNKSDTSLIKSVPILFKNKFWVICLCASLIYSMTASMGAGAYFAQYYLGNVEYTGTLSMAMVVPMFIGLPVSGLLLSKFGKRNTILAGLLFGLLGYIIPLFNLYSFPLAMVGMLIRGVSMIPMVACGFAMLADVIDYHEWKFGIRTEGIVYSASSFGTKVGTGLGAGILGWSLSFGKYDGTLATQPSSAMRAIVFVFLILPLVGCVINIFLYSQYTLEKIYPKIISDLAERRKAGGTGND